MRDPAEEIALEHVLWAAQDGQRPETIMDALGVHLKSASWDDVLLALRIVYRRLPRKPARAKQFRAAPLKRAA